MNTEDNTILEPFDYRIIDHSLYPQNHQSSLIESFPNSQISFNAPNQNKSNMKFVRQDKYFQGQLDPQVSLDEKTKLNEVIQNEKLIKTTQKQEKQGSNANDFYEKNHKWFQYLQSQQLQEQQVDIKERQKEIEKSIQRYDCEYRLLCCYYYFKWLIPATVILVPFLLYIYRY